MPELTGGLVREKVERRIREVAGPVEDENEIASKPSQGRESTGQPDGRMTRSPKTKTYVFRDEERVRTEWNFRNARWRLRNDGLDLKPDGGITSKTKFSGDCAVRIDCRIGDHQRMSIQIWGENFPVVGGKARTVLLVRKGNSVGLTRRPGDMDTYTLKQQQAAVPSSLSISFARDHWGGYSGDPLESFIYQIVIAGTAVSEPEIEETR